MEIYFDRDSEGLVVEGFWIPAKEKLDKGKLGFVDYGDGILGHVDEGNTFTVRRIIRDALASPSFFNRLGEKVGHFGRDLHMLFIGEVASFYATKYYTRTQLRDDMVRELAFWLWRSLSTQKESNGI